MNSSTKFLLSLLAVGAIVLTVGTALCMTSSTPSEKLSLNLKGSLAGNVQGSYTYFAFEREWPGTVCLTNSCTPQYMGDFDSNNFNLHGLWPSGLASNVCSYPQDCGSSQFSFAQISESVAAYMNMYWNGLYSSTQSFLNHEWTKHGTCYSGTDQNTFFTVATDLHRQYNPIQALAAVGIVPSNENGYSVADVKSALESSFGGPVYMQCKIIQGNQYFFAFDMYFDKELENVIAQPCTKSTSSCNASQSLYLPIVQLAY